VRSSQGGIFHTNLIEDVNLPEKLNQLKQNGYNILMFTPDAGKKLNGIDMPGKSVILFGSESHGLSGELLNSDYEKIKIEGYSDCESLNVAISCGIALYEISKY
jgi:TrmH family RNA methyltransferase